MHSMDNKKEDSFDVKFEKSTFIQESFKLVSFMLTADKSLSPLLLLSVDNTSKEGEDPKPGVIIAEFDPMLVNSGAGKDKLAGMIKDMLKGKPTTEFVFVTEAWAMARGTPSEYESMIVQRRMSVSELPNKYKDEIIMLSYYDLRDSNNKKSYTGMAVFTRDTEGNVLFVEDPTWILTNALGVKMEGRFTELVNML